MEEIFAKPCVGALIEKEIDGEKYILVQTRKKEDGGDTNDKLEIPAGKVREYENVFETVRREVWEETGLIVTKIQGEELAITTEVEGVMTLSFAPFCVTQNLAGAYGIVLNTFLCEAEGQLLKSTNETQDVRWMKVAEVRELVEKYPEKIFFIHLNALKKYLKI